MHGPSATPLLVELAAVVLVLAAAFARRPLARLVARRRRPAAIALRPARHLSEPS